VAALPVIAGGAAVLWLLFGRSKRRGELGATRRPTDGLVLAYTDGDPQAVESLLERAGMSRPWVRAVLTISWRESKWVSTAWNGDPGERAAALVGYDRYPERYACSGLPRSAYGFGSGGLYGFLPTTALASADTPCADPRKAVFDLAASTIAAVGWARYLVARGPADFSVAHVLAGWGLPSRLEDPQAVAARSATDKALLVDVWNHDDYYDERLPLSGLPTVAQAKANFA
jgi:hypothetical protein